MVLQRAIDKDLKITILGMGYIGLPTGIAFARAGYVVNGFDVNTEVIETLKSGKIHIVEPDLQEAFDEALKSGRFIPTSKLEKSDYLVLAQGHTEFKNKIGKLKNKKKYDCLGIIN
ncbi:MAG: hypothetical protein ACRC0W_01705 [Cetobacterium sp.]